MKRPNEVWESPCKKCPSAHYPPDPESIDMLKAFKQGDITFEEYTFPCAWRPEKLCKGVVDNIQS